MKIDVPAVRKTLKAFDFKTLFYEHLGWDKHTAHLEIPVGDRSVQLDAIAQKRGFVAFVCEAIPDRQTRLKIDHQVTKSVREHFVIYADEPGGQQVWHWVRRETGKPLASRDHRFDVSQSGDPLIQRLEHISVSMEEEEALTLPDIASRGRAAFDVDKVTKKFYERFKAEHSAFLKHIKGFPISVKKDGNPEQHPDLQWYTSLMLNRLMFVYFMQKKGFLDGDPDYLRDRLSKVQQARGKDKFQSFYRYFLLRLFHDGLGKSLDERELEPAMEKLLGKVPFLNGGFFEVHKLETEYPDIDIPDEAFEKLFDFFDLYSWHLDERPCRADNEINPDVIGYIFEKYINQKQMGAYYTKEDITEYISKNTIIPYLFDAAKKKCAIAFKPDSALWRLLQDDPDRYIYPAVGHGVTCDYDRVNHRDHKRRSEPMPLPPEIEAGVNDVSKRDGWNKTAPPEYGLPTETWREVVARRQRCLEIREKLSKGEVQEINDLITLNLDIWQFARDAIVNAEGPELLRAFWHTLVGRIPGKSNETIEQGITILDPTCGSGAFLFAALRILETLYSDCLERMERFIEDDEARMKDGDGRMKDEGGRMKDGDGRMKDGDGRMKDGDGRMKDEGGRMKGQRYSDFRHVLAQLSEHRGERYFILKSIIINNLFGVDIMEEAVEICKLRLFLKLVAQVEPDDSHPHYGLEPLPDIDFNIRAGNTLVGFASRKELENIGADDFVRKQEVATVLEEAEDTDSLFRRFQQCQTDGQESVAAFKKQLQDKFGHLRQKCDAFLADLYETGRSRKPKEFGEWKDSHQPFHWFVEFYGIMHAGGFDVIIGNPPYVEYAKIKKKYTVKSYNTESAGNLYAFVSERGFNLLGKCGSFGLIIPISVVCTQRMQVVQDKISSCSHSAWFSNYAERPSKLFEGAEVLLTIAIACAEGHGEKGEFTTGFTKWAADERPVLFSRMSYCNINAKPKTHVIPKLSAEVEASILHKMTKCGGTLARKLQRGSLHRVYYRIGGGRYWKIFTNFQPRFVLNGQPGISSRENHLFLPSEGLRDATIATLSSSLFYWYFILTTNCRDLNPSDLSEFPMSLDGLSSQGASSLVNLCKILMQDYKKNSLLKGKTSSITGQIVYQEFYPRFSKPIIDEIDRVLAEHYGFTDEELDFIINYDIKYRMGGAEEAD